MNGRPRVAVVMGTNGPWDDVGDLAEASLRPWCERHGYEFNRHKLREEDGEGRPGLWAWAAIRMLLRTLETTSAEWVIHPGADVVITNPAKGLEDLLDEAGSASLIASHCAVTNWPLYHLFRVDEWTRAFGRKWWEIGPCHPHLWDAGAFAKALETTEPDRVHWIQAGRIMADPGHWKPGDLMLHVAGHLNHDEKLRTMREFSERVNMIADCLNVGSGPCPVVGPCEVAGVRCETVINLDYTAFPGVEMVADIRNVDFPASAFKVIRAHEFLEHFERFDGERILASFRQWLVPRGTVEIKVPDVRALAECYVSPSDPDGDGDLIGRLYAHGDHKWGFTPGTLPEALQRNGFEIVSIDARRRYRDLVVVGRRS